MAGAMGVRGPQPYAPGGHRLTRELVHGLVVLTLTVCLTLWVGPKPLNLTGQQNGDPDLSARVRAASARVAGVGPDDQIPGFRSLSVIEVDRGTTRFAGVGNTGDGDAPTRDSMYELASITKLFTGLLLAHAVAKGEVRLQAPLETYLPELRGSQAGCVTLEELATHRSGLPAYADADAELAYEVGGPSAVETQSVRALIEESRSLSLSGRGTHQYSNLGVSLLGYALVRAAHEPTWNSLVTRRVLRPAGMTAVFAGSQADVPAAAVPGYRANGAVAPYTVGTAYQPAGTATFVSAASMGAFCRWVLGGRAIGLDALTPRHDVEDGDSIGLVWLTSEGSAGPYAWHNGAVPGFSSMLAVDRNRGRAVVVMGNAESSVDQIALLLLDPPAEELSSDKRLRDSAAVAGVAAMVVALLAVLRPRRLGWQLALGLMGHVCLVLLLRFGEWQAAPPWVWATAAAAVFWAGVASGDRGRAGPGRGAPPPGFTALRAALSLLLFSCVYGMAVWLSG